MLLIVTTFFSLASRALGVFGLIYLIKGCKSKAYSIFLIEVLILFVAAYMYLGQSRFRVPLEPTLMLFTVFGIIYFLKRK